MYNIISGHTYTVPQFLYPSTQGRCAEKGCGKILFSYIFSACTLRGRPRTSEMQITRTGSFPGTAAITWHCFRKSSVRRATGVAGGEGGGCRRRLSIIDLIIKNNANHNDARV